MNSSLRRAGKVLVTLQIVLLLASCSYPMLLDGPFVKSSIAGQSIRIVTAVRPFDSNEEVREAFLNRFERGVETVL